MHYLAFEHRIGICNAALDIYGKSLYASRWSVIVTIDLEVKQFPLSMTSHSLENPDLQAIIAHFSHFPHFILAIVDLKMVTSGTTRQNRP